MSYNIKVKTTEIKPIISMFPKEALKYYCPETNIRIMTTFEYILMYLGASLAGFCIGAAILTLAISKPVKKDKDKNKEKDK